MRNWNLYQKYWPNFWDIGFYSTYEELKPGISFRIISSIFCFYSTYEELKREIEGVLK